MQTSDLRHLHLFEMTQYRSSFVANYGKRQFKNIVNLYVLIMGLTNKKTSVKTYVAISKRAVSKKEIKEKLNCRMT